jgi:molybdenum cofactor cytidylyltransferase
LRQTSAVPLLAALGAERGGELVSIVGGGGKTSLLFDLLSALPGRNVATTTTRIFAAQIQQAEFVLSTEAPGWERELTADARAALLIGPVRGDKAHGVEPGVPGQLFARPDVASVIVEADGSRMLPVKAPAEHEPVVAPETTLLVAVAGIDCLAGPLRDTAHRPELVAEIVDADLAAPLSPRSLGRLLAHPAGGLKACPASARAVVLINKVESDAERELARAAAESALASERIERVIVGALRPRGSARDFDVFER